MVSPSMFEAAYYEEKSLAAETSRDDRVFMKSGRFNDPDDQLVVVNRRLRPDALDQKGSGALDRNAGRDN